MSENIEEKLEQMKDVSDSEKESRESGLELARNEETDDLVETADVIAQALEKDEPVVQGDVERLEEALQNVKVDFGGEEVSLFDLRNDSKMMRDLKFWKEIRSGRLDKAGIFARVGELTRVAPDILQRVASYNKHWETLSLRYVRYFSDECARALRNFNGFIDLESVKHLSDVAIEDLACDKSSSLNLKSLASLSDSSAFVLCNLTGQLYLDNLEHISEKGLRFLARKDRKTIMLSSDMDARVEKYRSNWSKLKKRLSKTKK